MSVRDGNNRHFAQRDVCADKPEMPEISAFRAFFQRRLQMVFETIAVINDTRSAGYVYPLIDLVVVHSLSLLKCEQSGL